MPNFERLRDRANNVMWGAGMAEIATSICIHEDKLALTGMGLIVASRLVESRGNRKDDNK